jgi:hypothetical protein
MLDFTNAQRQQWVPSATACKQLSATLKDVILTFAAGRCAYSGEAGSLIK